MTALATLDPQLVDDITMLTIGVWDTVLGLVAVEVPGDTRPTAVTSTVQITGEWVGAVSLGLSAGLADRVASTMFEVPVDALSTDEHDDAVGEMANVVGGNVKALLPGPSALSLPSVIAGEAPPHFPGAVEVQRLTFDVDGEPFVVTIHHAADHGDTSNQPQEARS